ncbi:hypothetical protein CSX11_28700 [Mycobacterium goodii]|nr:hypothetical protein CSX11_28700 [Mycolicibacterium goodii]
MSLALAISERGVPEDNGGAAVLDESSSPFRTTEEVTTTVTAITTISAARPNPHFQPLPRFGG